MDEVLDRNIDRIRPRLLLGNYLGLCFFASESDCIATDKEDDATG